MTVNIHTKIKDILSELESVTGINQKEELKTALINKGLTIDDSDTLTDMIEKINNIIIAKGNAQPEDVIKDKTFSNLNNNNLVGLATIESIGGLDKDNLADGLFALKDEISTNHLNLLGNYKGYIYTNKGIYNSSGTLVKSINNIVAKDKDIIIIDNGLSKYLKCKINPSDPLSYDIIGNYDVSQDSDDTSYYYICAYNKILDTIYCNSQDDYTGDWTGICNYKNHISNGHLQSAINIGKYTLAMVNQKVGSESTTSSYILYGASAYLLTGYTLSTIMLGIFN